MNVDDLTKVKGHFLDEQARAVRYSKIIAERTIDNPDVGNVIDHVAANVGIVEGGGKINMACPAHEPRRRASDGDAAPKNGERA